MRSFRHPTRTGIRALANLMRTEMRALSGPMPRRMRVAMVSEHASPLAVLGGRDAGGQNVHVAALATEMGRRGIEVTVYTRREDPATPKRVGLAPNVTVEHLSAGPAARISKDALLPYMGCFGDGLRHALGASPPDVVHAHFWMSGLASLAAARPLGLPVVQTFHALGVVKRRQQGVKDTSPPERCRVEEDLVANVDRIIATCTEEVRELSALGACHERVSVVPCGVDLDLFTRAGPVEPRTPGLRRLVVVSRLVERKGIGNVIAALSGVPETELIVVGGPERSRLLQDPEALRLLALAEECGVSGRVDLRGRVGRRELPAILRSADAVVSVPWYEPFGIVPLEAMACGVPVVGSAVGGLLDSVVPGVTGVLVPPRDPDALARALRALLEGPGYLEMMGAAGAIRASDRYSWARVATETLEAYAALHDRARRGTREART